MVGGEDIAAGGVVDGVGESERWRVGISGTNFGFWSEMEQGDTS